MRAITLHEPWASLVREGHKTIETRSWKTPYRGPIAIHAAQTIKSVEYLAWHEEHHGEAEPMLIPFADRMTVGESPTGLTIVTEHPFPLGCIVATADLLNCVPIITAGDDLPVGYEGPFVYCDGDWLQVHDGPEDSAPLYSETEQLYGDYRTGRWAWLFKSVQPIEPIPAKGKQGMWEWQRPVVSVA